MHLPREDRKLHPHGIETGAGPAGRQTAVFYERPDTRSRVETTGRRDDPIPIENGHDVREPVLRDLVPQRRQEFCRLVTAASHIPGYLKLLLKPVLVASVFAAL